MTELQKMCSGQLCRQNDFSILRKMARGYILTRRLNRISMLNQPRRNRIIKKLFGSVDGDTYYVQSPLYVDYGFNVHIGKNFLSNYNLVIEDEAPIYIGDNVMLAPNVTLTTDLHPMHPTQRCVRYDPQYFPSNHRPIYIHAKPIKIGSNVWICTGAIVCPGVTIGDNTIIGAGSVVTQDIPANVFACGIPCRVVREIADRDKRNVDLC